VNEQEWLTANTPRRLLRVLNRLHRRLRRPVDDRKLRFFALHCCRLAWPALVDDRSRRAVEVAEREMVGRATSVELAGAVREAAAAREEIAALYDRDPVAANLGARIAANVAAWVVARGFDQGILAKVRDSLAFRQIIPDRVGTIAFVGEYARALRDVFGNPFRPVALDPAWRTSDVLALARGIYAERAFDRMPILADALQDAGCANEEVLAHCRDAKQEHVRGCWVVDLLLRQA
jgi:hypothetical protein